MSSSFFIHSVHSDQRSSNTLPRPSYFDTQQGLVVHLCTPIHTHPHMHTHPGKQKRGTKLLTHPVNTPYRSRWRLSHGEHKKLTAEGCPLRAVSPHNDFLNYSSVSVSFHSDWADRIVRPNMQTRMKMEFANGGKLLISENDYALKSNRHNRSWVLQLVTANLKNIFTFVFFNFWNKKTNKLPIGLEHNQWCGVGVIS